MEMRSVRLNVDKETFQFEKADSVCIAPNSKQFIEKSGSDILRFLCIVQPTWKAENEILLE